MPEKLEWGPLPTPPVAILAKCVHVAEPVLIWCATVVSAVLSLMVGNFKAKTPSRPITAWGSFPKPMLQPSIYRLRPPDSSPSGVLGLLCLGILMVNRPAMK